jgi:hypothetical protein
MQRIACRCNNRAPESSPVTLIVVSTLTFQVMSSIAVHNQLPCSIHQPLVTTKGSLGWASGS